MYIDALIAFGYVLFDIRKESGLSHYTLTSIAMRFGNVKGDA